MIRRGAAIAGGIRKPIRNRKRHSLCLNDSHQWILDEALNQRSDIDDYQQLAAESAEMDQVKGPLDIHGERRGHILTNDTAFAQCINRLEEHPDSITNREELAALYVSHAYEPALQYSSTNTRLVCRARQRSSRSPG